MKAVQKKHADFFYILLSFVLFFAPYALYAQKSAAEEKIYRFFNDMLIYECTGIERNGDAARNSGVSRMPSVLFSCTKWTEDCRVGNLFDYYVPERAGLLSAHVAYNAADDGASWTEKLLFSDGNMFVIERPAELNEAAEKRDEIRSSMEDGTDSEELLNLVGSNASAAESTEPSGASSEAEPVAVRRLRNARQMLSLYSYGAEIFSVQSGAEGGSVIVSSFQKKMTRGYYDESVRLVKKEYWDLSGGVSNSAVTKTETFEYGDGIFPVSARIQEGNERHVLSYDENGRVNVSRNYRLLEMPSDTASSEPSSGKKRFVLVSRTEWKYTRDGKVSEKYFVEYVYKDASSSLVTARNSKREVFEYKIDGGLPDYYYYENSVLRMQTIYSGLNSYTSVSYFDDGFVVESYYIDGNHTKDLYYMNGTLWRSRIYE